MLCCSSRGGRVAPRRPVQRELCEQGQSLEFRVGGAAGSEARGVPWERLPTALLVQLCPRRWARNQAGQARKASAPI